MIYTDSLNYIHILEICLINEITSIGIDFTSLSLCSLHATYVHTSPRQRRQWRRRRRGGNTRTRTKDDSYRLVQRDQWHLSLTFNSIPRPRRSRDRRVKMPKCCAHDATQNDADTTTSRPLRSRTDRGPNQNKEKRYSACARARDSASQKQRLTM